MERWIKIDTAITKHWIFQNAEYFKWWFDLLSIGAWRDHKVVHDTHLFTLKRGQAIASIAFLSERWKRDRKMVIRFLKLLEEDGMITRTVRDRQTSILTICNYERYQYSKDTIGDTIEDTIGDTIGDTNSRKDRIYISSSSTTRARTCEENPENSENQFFEEMKTDEPWIEVVCMKFHLSRSDIISRMDDFMLDATCRKKRHERLSDMQRHFCDWLRIQLKIQKENENRNIGKSTGQRLEAAAGLFKRLLDEDTSETRRTIPDDMW